ncbi:hypothetical protein AB1Y20_022544 [Prymnesium parvum]
MAPRKLDASASRPAARFVTAHSGARDKDGRLKPFHDAPAAFRPNLTPQQMLEKGMHGGIYFNPLGGKPGILYPRSRYPKGIPGVSIDEFPPEWFKGVPPGLYKSRKYSVQNNFYKVKSGLDQAGWESNGWINECDPRGWTQWYFRFYMGRRLDNGEDERQIGRWLGVAGDKGRWKQNLIGKCLRDRKAFDDPSVSPVVRQTLLHWAYELTEADFEKGARRVKTHGAYAIPADQLHGVTVKTQGKRKFTQGDDVQEASTKVDYTEQKKDRAARASRRGEGLPPPAKATKPPPSRAAKRKRVLDSHVEETPHKSDYEKQRDERKRQNLKQLAELGLT